MTSKSRPQHCGVASAADWRAAARRSPQLNRAALYWEPTVNKQYMYYFVATAVNLPRSREGDVLFDLGSASLGFNQVRLYYYIESMF